MNIPSTLTTCTQCGEEVRPQLFHEPYTCRSCRAANSIQNEIAAAARRKASPEYIRGLNIALAAICCPELVGVY